MKRKENEVEMVKGLPVKVDGALHFIDKVAEGFYHTIDLEGGTYYTAIKPQQLSLDDFKLEMMGLGWEENPKNFFIKELEKGIEFYIGKDGAKWVLELPSDNGLSIIWSGSEDTNKTSVMLNEGGILVDALNIVSNGQ